jgi:ABC-type tungstate transport system, permease component
MTHAGHHNALIPIFVIQIPWAYAYSKWYHQYPLFPIPALIAASRLQEYTLTHRSTFLAVQSLDRTSADQLDVFKAGGDDDPNDPLLSPASFLLGAKVCHKNLALAQGFIKWITDPNGGQVVVKAFKKPGASVFLYTGAPDCKVEPTKCIGW